MKSISATSAIAIAIVLLFGVSSPPSLAAEPTVIVPVTTKHDDVRLIPLPR